MLIPRISCVRAASLVGEPPLLLERLFQRCGQVCGSRGQVAGLEQPRSSAAEDSGQVCRYIAAHGDVPPTGAMQDSFLLRDEQALAGAILTGCDSAFVRTQFAFVLGAAGSAPVLVRDSAVGAMLCVVCHVRPQYPRVDHSRQLLPSRV